MTNFSVFFFFFVVVENIGILSLLFIYDGHKRKVLITSIHTGLLLVKLSPNERCGIIFYPMEDCDAS